MILKSILAGSFKLDGGAMFGVVPKRIWNRFITCDENNLCTWALRCLYFEYDTKKILIDTGLGNKQDQRFFSHYEPAGDILIEDALLKNNISIHSITDVIFTHLHFDHCGGAIKKMSDDTLQSNFPNAKFWVHKSQWTLANNPNAREKASFLKENIELLEKQLHFIDDNNSPFTSIDFIKVNGHTEGMLLPMIDMGVKKILFGADLFPSVHHIPLPYVMGYDMQPLVTLLEKEKVLDTLSSQKIALFFEHDYQNEIAIIKKNEETNKYYVESTMKLTEYLGID